MTPAPEIRAALKTPFSEQVEFFRAKLGNQILTDRWTDVWKERHDTGFMVAGAAKADLLADLAAAVDKAIGEGGSIGAFRKDFDQIVERHGWAYKGSRNWRTRVIYRTNAATSYAAGRLAQLQAFPFWLYKHGGSADPRPEHLAWDGLVLDAKHPFWATHYPPNGWGCSCRVVGVRDKGDAKPYGGEPSKLLPEGWDDLDEDTGEPPGIGRGWGYQPGATSDLLRQLKTKAGTLPPPLARALVKDLEQIAAKPAPRPKLETLDDYIGHGRQLVDGLGNANAQAPEVWVERMLDKLRAEVGIGQAAKIANGGAGAKQVGQVSALFPRAWIDAADAAGTLAVRATKSRQWQWTAKADQRVRLSSFGIVDAKAGQGWLTVELADQGVALHEFAHRLQGTMPALDDMFQQLHRRRTDGDPLRRLRDVTGSRGYTSDEMTREDHYFNAYQGKDYKNGGALEVITMAYEALLAPAFTMRTWRLDNFRKLYNNDREMFDLAVGLLFGWRP